MTLSVVTFKWRDPDYHCKFTSEHVNILARMVARHYPDPHRVICFTNDSAGIDPAIEVLPMWNDHANVPNPSSGLRPSCYRRLKMFDPVMREVVGDRFVWLDLDAVIVDDLRPLWNRTEEVVLWKSPHLLWPYNGAMVLATSGARPQVWNDFHPVNSPKATEAVGYRGSDQAWLSFCIPGEAVWSEEDGVYYNGKWLQPSILPSNARIVFFIGRAMPDQSRLPWVKEHYR